MSGDQSYLGSADPQTAGGEYNQYEFLARMVVGRIATATAVLVKAVDPVARTVDVQPCVAQIDGYGNATPHGTIHALPYAQLQAGNNGIILPPAVGDIGVAVFASTDISSVKVNKAPSNPGSRRRFDWSDGMYLMALWTPVALARYIDFSQTNVTIQPNGTLDILGKLHVTDDVTFDKKLQAADTINSDVDVTGNGISLHDHTHDGVTTGSGNTGPPNP